MRSRFCHVEFGLSSLIVAHQAPVYPCLHGPLTRYVKLQVAHAPGMSGTFSPPPTSMKTAFYRSRHASRHVRHARVVMHVGIANRRWRGKRSRHSRHMRNSQIYVFGKRPMAVQLTMMFYYAINVMDLAGSMNRDHAKVYILVCAGRMDQVCVYGWTYKHWFYPMKEDFT